MRRTAHFKIVLRIDLNKKMASDWQAKMLDLAFAMDCTGSMDSYISEAKDNIEKIVTEVVASEKCDVRLALVEYRDHPPEDLSFITKKHDFTDSSRIMKTWLSECCADGGGDTPEAVADALNDLLNLSWRKEATKMCVLISDAPPHGIHDSSGEDQFPEGCPLGLDPMEITRQLAGLGAALYVVGCEPSVSPYKDFYLAIAQTGGGQYVPLTEAKGLSKIIIYGSVEEISLKKFEAEAVQEILKLKSSGKEINEAELSSSLHKRWEERGEKTKQLTRNQHELESAKSSTVALKMSKMRFDDARKLFSSSKDGKGMSNKDTVDEIGATSTKDEEMKMADVTNRIKDIRAGSADSIKVDMSGLGTVDFGPASSEKGEEDSEYQCIDGGVTFSQTMRVVTRSLHKMSKSNPME